MGNELIFIITVAVVFAYVLLCFRLGRRWLYASIATNLILIGVFGAKLVELFGSVTNVGNIFYVAVFFTGQLLVEHYGKTEGKKSILIGFAGAAFFTLMGQLTIAFAPALNGSEAASILERLFEFSPRIAAASLLAYVFSQMLNIHLYSYVMAKKPDLIWLRSFVASAAGQALDSIIFFTIAFAGVLAVPELAIAAITGYVVKLVVGTLSIPFIYVSYHIKTRRDILGEEAEAVLTSIGEGVVVTDHAGLILLANKRFVELTGWKAEEVLGKKMVDVLVRQDESGRRIPDEERILTQVLTGREMASTVGYSYLMRKDGTRFPAKISVTSIYIDEKIVGAVELFSDMTAEKQLEQTRTDFLSLASHQLRTPLSGTRWVLETLQRGIAGEMNEKQRKYIEHLYDVNMRMIKLASDMLRLLNLESKKTLIIERQFPVRTLFEQVAQMLAATAEEKGVVIEMPPESLKTEVETDVGMAVSILESMVANAIHYSDIGQSVVLGSTETPEEVILFVKDQGIGIPQDEQSKIFERFYRASNAKLMLPDGTGLGLSISKMIAEKIGAKITLVSKEGKGSTFSLHIPKHPAS